MWSELTSYQAIMKGLLKDGGSGSSFQVTTKEQFWVIGFRLLLRPLINHIFLTSDNILSLENAERKKVPLNLSTAINELIEIRGVLKKYLTCIIKKKIPKL